MRTEFKIESWLEEQAASPVSHMLDPNSYLYISKAMDSFTMELPGKVDGKPCLVTGLSGAMQPALIIGAQHDMLFPVWQQKEVADALRAAGNKSVVFYELGSMIGHNAFQSETVSIGAAIKGHLELGKGALGDR